MVSPEPSSRADGAWLAPVGECSRAWIAGRLPRRAGWPPAGADALVVAVHQITASADPQPVIGEIQQAAGYGQVLPRRFADTVAGQAETQHRHEAHVPGHDAEAAAGVGAHETAHSLHFGGLVRAVSTRRSPFTGPVPPWCRACSSDPRVTASYLPVRKRSQSFSVASRGTETPAMPVWPATT